MYVVVPLWRLSFQSGLALTYNYIFGHTGKTGPRNSGFTTAPWRGPKVRNSGESGLKGAGFEGGGKCGEIGHCNQAGRNPWLLPDHARQCWLGFTPLNPKSSQIPKSRNALPWAGVSHVILCYWNARNPCGRSKVTAMYSISRSKEPRLLPAPAGLATASLSRSKAAGQWTRCVLPRLSVRCCTVSTFFQYCNKL